jgi:glycosyltransferase involved in cell wall biosynthesis
VTSHRSLPREVLVVGWFPAVDETSAGRFVADQVAALRATGAVRLSVVSFENAAVRGHARLRGRQSAAIAANGAASLAWRDPFNARGAAGPPDIPLARLTVAAGETPETGVDHRAAHRAAALLPLIERGANPAWELVHAHVGYPEGAASAQAAARLGVPLVLTEHATYLASLFADPTIRARYAGAARAAARVIAVSRMLADELTAAIPELAGRIVVIPNAVAVDDFGGGSPAERVPGELLWVGNRTETKGIPTLLRAFALIHERRPESILRLIGRSFRPEHETAWQRLAADLGVGAAVQFEPPLDRAGVAVAMRRADLFVHPSTRETFGVVAVEALASGLPVVAADSGGVTEVLGDDPSRLGALVPAGDPAALATAVIEALDRRASFEPAVLRAHAVEQFGAARVAARIVELYEEILSESAPPSRLTNTMPQQRPAAGQGTPVDLPARTVVVGFSRAELDRAISNVPGWVFDGVEVVTTGGAPPGRARAHIAPSGSESRVADLLDWGAPTTGPIGRLARRIRRARRRFEERVGVSGDSTERLLADLARTLDSALPESGGEEAPLLVCLSGLDHLVASPFIAEGRAVAAPGGLRWLADARASGQKEQTPAQADAGEPEASASSEA